MALIAIHPVDIFLYELRLNPDSPKVEKMLKHLDSLGGVDIAVLPSEKDKKYCFLRSKNYIFEGSGDHNDYCKRGARKVEEAISPDENITLVGLYFCCMNGCVADYAKELSKNHNVTIDLNGTEIGMYPELSTKNIFKERKKDLESSGINIIPIAQ